jgi:hypothetical protein
VVGATRISPGSTCAWTGSTITRARPVRIMSRSTRGRRSFDFGRRAVRADQAGLAKGEDRHPPALVGWIHPSSSSSYAAGPAGACAAARNPKSGRPTGRASWTAVDERPPR